VGYVGGKMEEKEKESGPAGSLPCGPHGSRREEKIRGESGMRKMIWPERVLKFSKCFSFFLV
jgi:hypothetical protein